MSACVYALYKFVLCFCFPFLFFFMMCCSGCFEFLCKYVFCVESLCMLFVLHVICSCV